ncbi:ankyrin repeat domain-containing protein 53 [Tiliqua scincoides]|uniref:ankyrin repeat domain-containing protein 53 n=1 Tax=Tiliqua scincoides TaxID=71010 RepID=UPI003462163B
MASLHGRLDCIKMLIEKYHVDVDLVSATGWRPLHLVMSRESEGRALECLQYLIGKGADVNVQNQNGVSPLHKAASEGRRDCIKALVEAGADVHAKDIEGQEPIDLCKMWGHRACAKYLSSATWKRDKADFAREVFRLNQLKEECEIREKEFLKREQRELDFVNSMAYERWLEKKCLPPPSDRILGFLKKRAQSVSLSKPTGTRVSGPAFPPARTLVALPESRDLLRPSWNISTNVCSAPATSIIRPSTIRMGIDPEKPLEHDFSSFLLLFRDSFGKPKIYVSNWGKVSTMPDLPFEIIQRSIYPHTQITRLEGPQDFKSRHIFDVASKRHPSPEHRWTDQMALSLRETLDPTYIGTLKAHLAMYTDPRVVFPQLEPDCTSGKESSMQSQASSSLN